MRVLVIDSGKGGRVVERYLKSMKPDIDLIYACDEKNMPYGEKSTEEILELTRKMIAPYEDKYDILAVACNTISAAMIRTGKLPYSVVDVILPTIRELRSQNLKKLGIISTEYTYRSGIYSRHLNLIPSYSNTLARLIEDGMDENKEEIIEELKNIISPMIERGMKRLILGCTHYELIDYMIRDLYPHLELLYPGKYQAELVLRRMRNMKKRR
ncbi:MAG: aspartate/glutamate racemase family protein [Ezakiella sp.]|nr:aspartate/glutamate racemase family protein [Ezakiella sp.]MDD7761518.1 aspartate/glutamate racemase family protein [Bacillota bacterium]MDY3947664.1 aspartate/glutamate racemase family protein [Ezakiella sp.]